MSKNTGWGYKLDYDLEIAYDEQCIRFTTMCIARGLYARSRPYLNPAYQEAYGDYVESNPVLAICYFPDMSEKLGYSPQDIADLAYYTDVDVWESFPDFPNFQDIHNGKRIHEELVAAGFIDKSGGAVLLYKSEEDAKAALRKYRADLARHKRNKAKYG